MNWQTTLTGVASLILGGCIYQKWITAEQSAIILSMIVGVLGYLSKDKNVTGGTREQ